MPETDAFALLYGRLSSTTLARDPLPRYRDTAMPHSPGMGVSAPKSRLLPRLALMAPKRPKPLPA